MNLFNFYSKCKPDFTWLTVFVFFILAGQIYAQQTLVLNAGIGYTAVDKEKWSDYDELYDWNLMMIEAYAQFYFLKWGNLDVGAEGGYQDLFWYEYEYYDGYYRNYYEYDVNCWRIMGVLKNEMNNNMFAELGAGVFLFEEFTDMGISGALGYHLKINENIILPVKVRGEIIFDDATNLYVIGLNIGWAFHIGQ